MDTAATTEDQYLDRVATVRDLDQAVTLMFENNLDVVTQRCFVTLMKLLDNLLQKPHDDRVRTIRLANPAFAEKVGRVRGGCEFLLACGFEYDNATTATANQLLLLQPLQSSTASPQHLTLPAAKENTQHLVTARRLLTTRAIQTLGMKADALPVYKPPAAPVQLVSSSSSNSTTSNNSNSNTFNPYAGQRFDAQSAAVGTNLGPDAHYVSKTDTALQQLRQRQAQLEAARPVLEDPSWKAFRPHESIVVGQRASTTASASSTTNKNNSSDTALLAARLKQQQHERHERQHGGFTTQAMRDLKRLQTQKVYRHATLTIQFPDGHKVVGDFAPSTRVSTVRDKLAHDCLTASTSLSSFDLYVTPPRRLLPADRTLQQEGLVPAAKVFCSWHGPPPAASYLHEHLFGNSQSTSSIAFPTSQSLVDDNNNTKQKQQPPSNAQHNKTTTTDREEDLLRRMMGGGGGMKKTKKSGNNAKKTPPKWFKS